MQSERAALTLYIKCILLVTLAYLLMPLNFDNLVKVVEICYFCSVFNIITYLRVNSYGAKERIKLLPALFCLFSSVAMTLMIGVITIKYYQDEA